jgi:hypothetical protein
VWVPPIYIYKHFEDFLFETNRISDADSMELEMVGNVPLPFMVTAFDGGEGSLTFSSLY